MFGVQCADEGQVVEFDQCKRPEVFHEEKFLEKGDFANSPSGAVGFSVTNSLRAFERSSLQRD